MSVVRGQALGYDEAAEIIIAPPARVSDTIHELLCEELRRYFFIGGMPESVKAYKETGSIRESFATLTDRGYCHYKYFKALMSDIGFMRYLTGMPVDVEYGKADLLSIYRGAMAEQFVGHEMVLSQGENIYYWSRRAKSSSAEVDFAVAINGNIHPVEVKSGSSGRLKSLHLFLKTYQNSPGGIVFSGRPYDALPEKGFIFMPLYFAFSASGGTKVSEVMSLH